MSNAMQRLFRAGGIILSALILPVYWYSVYFISFDRLPLSMGQRLVGLLIVLACYSIAFDRYGCRKLGTSRLEETIAHASLGLSLLSLAFTLPHVIWLFPTKVALCRYGFDWAHVNVQDFASSGLLGQWAPIEALTSSAVPEGTAATRQGFSEYVVSTVEAGGTASLGGRARFAAWTAEMPAAWRILEAAVKLARFRAWVFLPAADIPSPQIVTGHLSEVPMRIPQRSGRSTFKVVCSEEDSEEVRLLVVPSTMGDALADARGLGLDRVGSEPADFIMWDIFVALGIMIFFVGALWGGEELLRELLEETA